MCESWRCKAFESSKPGRWKKCWGRGLPERWVPCLGKAQKAVATLNRLTCCPQRRNVCGYKSVLGSWVFPNTSSPFGVWEAVCIWLNWILLTRIYSTLSCHFLAAKWMFKSLWEFINIDAERETHFRKVGQFWPDKITNRRMIRHFTKVFLHWKKKGFIVSIFKKRQRKLKIKKKQRELLNFTFL